MPQVDDGLLVIEMVSFDIHDGSWAAMLVSGFISL
jgi:hypothetical protein